MTSSMAISTFWPRLVRWRARSASVTPCAPDMPATRSAMELPTFTGGPSADAPSDWIGLRMDESAAGRLATAEPHGRERKSAVGKDDAVVTADFDRCGADVRR